MDDLFLEDLGEKIGLQNTTMKIRGAFSSLIWKDPPLNYRFFEVQELGGWRGATVFTGTSAAAAWISR